LKGKGGAEVPPPVNGAGRLAHIDALRAGSVLLVVLMHSGVHIAPGDGGVTVFFTVSGFIITTLLIQERRRTGSFRLKDFYVRRFLKLAPPFVVIIAVPTIIYALWHEVDWPVFLSQVFFTYNWAVVHHPPDGSDALLPGSSIVWSLAVEEQFYIFFSVLWIALLKVERWRGVLVSFSIGATVTSMILRAGLATSEAGIVHASRGTDARMDAIAIGVLAALLWDRWQDGSVRWLRHAGNDAVLPICLVAFAAGSLILRSDWLQWTFRPTLQALVAACLLLYGLLARHTRGRRIFDWLVGRQLVQTIGLASYSIYLSHFVIISLLLEPLTRTWSPTAQVVLMALSTVALGVALYYCIEVPALRLKRRWQPPRASSTHTSGATQA
jgi:peptidoglycan/LPS O-acetylase OafA/YrhL